MVRYEARFRDGSKKGEDELDDNNSIKKTCADAVGELKKTCDGMGIPTLGHIKHGDPAGSTSWAKNVEIRFKLTPCKENSLKKCKFDIKREAQGRAGDIDEDKNSILKQNLIVPALNGVPMARKNGLKTWFWILPQNAQYLYLIQQDLEWKQTTPSRRRIKLQLFR